MILYKWSGSIYFTLDSDMMMTITDKRGEEIVDGDDVVFVDPKLNLDIELLRENQRLSECDTTVVKKAALPADPLPEVEDEVPVI